MSKTLKAYQVSDGDEQCVVVFATSNAAARREGGNEMGCEWEGVDYCRRVQSLDSYAPGPVPPLALIDEGWWFECVWCGRRVGSDMDEEDEDGLPFPDGPVVAIGQSVFCCAEHAARQMARWRGNAAAKNALCELVYARWPEAQIVRVHVYGDRLDYQDPAQGGWLTSVEFMLPSLRYPVTYHWGCKNMWVTQHDVDLFKAMYGTKS